MKKKSKRKNRRRRWNSAGAMLSLVGNTMVLTAVTSRPDHYDVSPTTLWVAWPIWALCLIGTTWLVAFSRP
ncbi:hypothetical protein [Streptomyces albipurpureus]|uniref:Uncharacterized protein n=1 Tax=Streptomyces albipurpureus TaxID=2897419 RepID=A0ABT0UU80_9ACTN|nr:hypothetical protein [Streptomyces sp. CWNU-1]MCM2391655.1 hypothetical protein [Streptomyces sp. CWNU-1]